MITFYLDGVEYDASLDGNVVTVATRGEIVGQARWTGVDLVNVDLTITNEMADLVTSLLMTEAA